MTIQERAKMHTRKIFTECDVEEITEVGNNIIDFIVSEGERVLEKAKTDKDHDKATQYGASGIITGAVMFAAYHILSKLVKGNESLRKETIKAMFATTVDILNIEQVPIDEETTVDK